MKATKILKTAAVALVLAATLSLSSCSLLAPFYALEALITAPRENREREARLREEMDLEKMLEAHSLVEVCYPAAYNGALVSIDTERLKELTSPEEWVEIDKKKASDFSPYYLDLGNIVFREDGTARVKLREAASDDALTLYFEIPDAEFENIRAYAEELYTVVYPQQEYEKKKEEARAQIDLDTLILEYEGYLVYPEGSQTGTETTADTLYGKVQPLFWTPTEASPSPNAKPILTLLLGDNDSKEYSKEDSEDGNTLEIVSDKTAVLKFSLGKDHPTFEFYFTVPDSDYSTIRDFAAEIAPE